MVVRSRGRRLPSPRLAPPFLLSEGNQQPGRGGGVKHRYAGRPHPNAERSQASPSEPGGEAGTEKPAAAEEAATAPAARARPAAGERGPEPPVRKGGLGRGVRARGSARRRGGGRGSPGRSRLHRDPCGARRCRLKTPLPQTPPPLSHWPLEKRGRPSETNFQLPGHQLVNRLIQSEAAAAPIALWRLGHTGQ